jgi:hypothetical protein
MASVRDLQAVLAAAGFYTGAVDGKDGPLTQAAVAVAGRNLAGLYPVRSPEWSPARRRVAALQACLAHLGFEPGAVDGLMGHNTENALRAFLVKRETGKDWVVPRLSVVPAPKTDDMPRQRDCASFYGNPGPEVQARLVTVDLPYPLRLDYDLGAVVRKVTLHRLCAPSFVQAMVAVRAEYGAGRQIELGLDRYAGGYMHRKMRGGSNWSMHSYGCAVDFYAAPNGLTTRCPQALFCGADYKPFLDIMEAHGWLPAVRLWGADAMHFQRARL